MPTKRYKVADNSAITIGGFIVKQNQILKDGLLTDSMRDRLLKMSKIVEVDEAAVKAEVKEAKEANKKDQVK
jgi:hypothetical protein